MKKLKAMVAEKEAEVARQHAKGALWAGEDTDLTAVLSPQP